MKLGGPTKARLHPGYAGGPPTGGQGGVNAVPKPGHGSKQAPRTGAVLATVILSFSLLVVSQETLYFGLATGIQRYSEVFQS